MLLRLIGFLFLFLVCVGIGVEVEKKSADKTWSVILLIVAIINILALW